MLEGEIGGECTISSFPHAVWAELTLQQINE